MAVETFEPADFSMQELAFLRGHLMESPTVALHGGLPPGVDPGVIKRTLGRFTELEELNRIKKIPWVGYEPIGESIDRFVAFQAKCLEGQSHGEPRHPSQKTWDSMGNMTDGGIGSDAAEKVRSELLPDGTRRTFAVPLVQVTKRSKMWGVKVPGQTEPDAITYDDNGTYTCSICEKVVASFDTDKGTRARNKARAEARTHCMKARTEVARHRAIANVPVA
jgi:hypothetical protein